MKKILSIMLVGMILPAFIPSPAFADSCPSTRVMKLANAWGCSWTGAPHVPDPYKGKPYPFDSRDTTYIIHPIPGQTSFPWPEFTDGIVTGGSDNSGVVEASSTPSLDQATSTATTTVSQVASSSDEVTQSLMQVLIGLLQQLVQFYISHPESIPNNA